jgi:hypothetical protein
MSHQIQGESIDPFQSLFSRELGGAAAQIAGSS